MVSQKTSVGKFSDNKNNEIVVEVTDFYTDINWTPIQIEAPEEGIDNQNTPKYEH